MVRKARKRSMQTHPAVIRTRVVQIVSAMGGTGIDSIAHTTASGGGWGGGVWEVVAMMVLAKLIGTQVPFWP